MINLYIFVLEDFLHNINSIQKLNNRYTSFYNTTFHFLLNGNEKIS